MEAHDAAVQAIASQVKSFHQRQAPFRIYHGATNSTRKSQRRADNTIDTSRLDHVLSVDAARRTALVEPNVPMDQLVHATLEEAGLVPPVVMEFPGITVGGGFSGTSGESSSFRHGAFDTTVESIEIVLPDGTLARASKTERTDVFWGAASAFGTLGVVTLLEVQLRPAKAYVRLAYSLCTSSAEDAVAAMRRACADEANDFVDGIVFDMHTTLVCAGYMVDELPAGEKARTFTARSDPWFYIRARQVARQLKQQQQQQQQEKTKTKTRNKELSSSSPSSSSPPPPPSSTSSSSSSSRAKNATAPQKEGQDQNDKRDQKGEKQAPSSVVVVVVVDYIPLIDYLFRYDRGGFWVGKYSFAYFLTPFNRVTRFLLDRFMHTRVMYRAVHRSGLADYYMVQDVGVPLDRAAEFQRWLDDAFGIYPLWLCPLHVRRRWPDSHHGLHASFAASAAAADDDPSSPSPPPPPPSASASCSQPGGGSSKGHSSADDLMNFGVWGPLPRGTSRRDVVALNRALERQVQRLGGKKWLYAHAYYPEDEFWQNYDRASYDALRARYAAQYLPSVYDKVRVDVDAEEAARNRTWRTRSRARLGDVWPLRGLKGFVGAARGGDYLMRRSGRAASGRAGGALEGMRE